MAARSVACRKGPESEVQLDTKLDISDHISTVHLAMLGPIGLEVPNSKGKSHQGHTLVLLHGNLTCARANNQL